MDDDADSCSILAKLQSSSDLHRIDALVGDHLRPFKTLLISPNPNPKKTRALAKRYISFLNQALSLIPDRLLSKIDPCFAHSLFKSYRLCLQCLQCIAPHLSCKPYMVHSQRARLVRCYDRWCMYKEAEAEGFSVLEDLDKKRGRFVPVFPVKDNADCDLGFLVAQVVTIIVKCLYLKENKVESDYTILMVLVDEAIPWIRILDASAHEKFHRVLVTYMTKCSTLLLGELKSFNTDLVLEFLSATFAEYRRSSAKDQLHKYAARVCSSLLSLQDDQSPSILNILSCVLDSIAECKVDDERTTIELLELVSYCANKCRNAAKRLCIDLAIHIKKMRNDLHQVELILKLYSIGLFLSDSCSQPGENNTTTKGNINSGSFVRFLLDKDEVLHDLSEMFRDEANGVCKMKNMKLFLLPFYNAIKFVCQPLANAINSARNEIFSQVGGACSQLCPIRDALLLYFDVFLLSKSTLEQKSMAFDDYDRATLVVAVAALALSFRTNSYIKKSVKIIEEIIVADWVQANALKFLCACIYNIGVTLFRSNQVKEASVALELCYRAVWACVKHLRNAFVEKTFESCDDVSEDDVNCVNEACAKSVFLLDILYECNDHNKAIEVIKTSLEEWSEAAKVFKRLPSPLALVKQWAKIECKFCKGPDMEGGAVSLYSLLAPSTSVSRSLGVILEQELLSYNEVRALNPKLCHKMRMDIVDVLLTKVYATDDVEKSKILIIKGQELRTLGFEGLSSCIQCLSEAISLLDQLLKKNSIMDERGLQAIAVGHHLAVAYSLRALSAQEAEPNSEIHFEDIHTAISLWLSPDCLADYQCDMTNENVLIILYHVIDMISLKGCTDFPSNIYKLLIMLFTKKKIPLSKCVALLWQCRRLSHALCPSPLNEAFVSTLLQHCGKRSQSMEFWKNCLSGSLPLEIGFWQRFNILKVKVDDVKQAAAILTSSVPFSSDSAFLAGHLYYDLCERMVSYGRLSEALAFGKEAHRLRCKLLQERFRYSTNQESEVNDETVQQRRYTFSYFQIHSSVATAAWPQDKQLFSLEGTVLTPWNVLQCYLESTLQVGIVHELMGDGSPAESLLLWGKSISSLQGLPLFKLAFSSVLGRVYCKKQLWDQAEKELRSAEKILNNTSISCSKCRLLMEVTVFLELGDLFRSRRDSYIGNLCVADDLYKLAIDKLNVSEWKNSVSNPKELRDEHAFAHNASSKKVQSQANVPEAKIKRSRTTKNSAKHFLQEQCSTFRPDQRVTRSKYRCQTNNENSLSEEVQIELTEHANNLQHLVFADTLNQRCPTLEINSSLLDLGTEMSSYAQYCIPVEAMQSGHINNFLLMKWEFARRQLLLKLLSGLGKCMDARGKTHESHKQLMQSITVLVSRNSFSEPSSVHLTVLLDLIGKDIPENAFAIEHAALLYNICWFTLKSYSCKRPRRSCCDMANFQIPNIISWLMLAFVLCREVPALFQKVSRLLAVVFVLSASTELFSLPVALCETLSDSHWASYFHQASVGTHVNHRVFSSMIGKEKVHNSLAVEGCCLSNSRLVPQNFKDLEEHAQRFFRGFPSATIIGISLLGDSFASLLSKVLKNSKSASAWLLLSRLNSDFQPVVLLLPVVSTLEEASHNYTNLGSGILFEDKEVTKCWHSPWGITVVDEVAPVFRQILEKSYLSFCLRDDTQQNRTLWWKQRKSLDQQLGKFMRDLEKLWLGEWKYFLMGEWSVCEDRESVSKKLVHDLKAECKVDARESLLKVVSGGAKLAFLREECLLQIILNGGCWVGGMDTRENHKALADRCDGIENLSEKVLKIIREAAAAEDLNREPVILVLDYDIQMLPWESLPILRNQEVYRMPSICSIFATLDRYHQCQGQLLRQPVAFPMIDPLDAFYVLNPSGDLINTQAEFEDWFLDQNLEGKTGISPTVEELMLVLRNHDLFIYFGHGSGTQYIPEHEIQKLENCAATLLMGCSSGSLSLNGCYAPKGAPLSYLLAGSPVIIANLWDVTDKDIDRFGKAMIDNWLRERSAASSDCIQCTNPVIEKFKSMQSIGIMGNTSRKNPPPDVDLCAPNNCCNHRPKIGSFVGQARDACTLPFLIGAAPVCYGVPTCIKRKKA